MSKCAYPTRFLRLILQHVRPKGFRRARNYGFLHPNRKSLIALLNIDLKIAPRTLPVERPRPAFLCPCCSAPMQIIRRRIPLGTVRQRSSATMAETAG